MRWLLAFVLLLLAISTASAGWPLKLGGIASSSPPPAPAITSSTTATGTTGSPFFYQITATNSPTSYSASGLPSWASLNTSNGQITGAPDAAATTNATINATNAGGTGSGPLAITVTAPGSYTGPCDLRTCAEGYSLNSAVTSSYSGPLFQVVVGDQNTNIATATTHDAVQTSDHKLDLTNLTAVCGSPLSNCIVSKIYAQLHGSANDLPTAGFRCSNSNCAAQLNLDGTGTVAQIAVGIPQSRLSGGGVSQYTIASDALATGITGGAGPISVMINMHMDSTPDPCCGFFGISHLWSDADITGTDFILAIEYDSRYGPPCGLGNATDYCTTIDKEGAALSPTEFAVFTTVPKDLVYFATTDGTPVWNSATWINGTQYIPGTVPTGLNVPAHVHLGGGGDLTWPAPATFREGIFWNTALSTSDEAAIFANEQARYPALSFNGSSGSYTGPCDIRGCAEAFSLNSAMTASYSGPLFQVIQGVPGSTNPSGLTTHDAIQTGAHKLDIADLTSFCGAPTFIASGTNVPTGGVYIYGCLVSKIYAQIHTGANDEVPSYFRCANPNCYGAIALDSTQTTAQILVGTSSLPTGYINYYAAEYIVAGDAPATGIPAGTAPLSMMVNYFFAQDTSPCCTGFGVGETWNNPLNDAAGLATMGGVHATGYALTGGCGPGDTINYCINIAIQPADFASAIVADHPVNNVELFAIDGTSSHNWTDDANGATLITSSNPSWNLTDGAHLRCGGGADLTIPGALWFREGAFWNSALGSTDRAAIFANEQARYPALTFP